MTDFRWSQSRFTFLVFLPLVFPPLVHHRPSLIQLESVGIPFEHRTIITNIYSIKYHNDRDTNTEWRQSFRLTDGKIDCKIVMIMQFWKKLNLIKPLIPNVSGKFSVIFPVITPETFSLFIIFKIRYIWYTTPASAPYSPAKIETDTRR